VRFAPPGRVFLSMALFATGIFLTKEARADFSMGLTEQAIAGATYPLNVGMGLDSDSNRIDSLRGAKFRLLGGKAFAGAGLDALFTVDRVRFGFGYQMFGIEGARLRYEGAREGFSLKGREGMALAAELFLGYELATGPVIPYIDVRADITWINATAEVRHVELGVVGVAGIEGWLFGLGPRIGAKVPLHPRVFLDGSLYYGAVGVQRVVGSLGFGVWLGGNSEAMRSW
jgi:hypothetical protein